MLHSKKNFIAVICSYDFLGCFRVDPDPKIKIKFLALHHLQQGKKIVEVADMVLVDERTVRSWLKAFVLFDYEGLIERPGRGWKPRLPAKDEESFKIEIDKIQEAKNGGRIIAEDIQKLLFEKIKFQPKLTMDISV